MQLCRAVSIFFFAILLLGCDKDTVFKVSDKAPVISIKKVGNESFILNTVEMSIQLVADRAPKTDLLVFLNVSTKGSTIAWENEERGFTGWATIPKGKKASKVFSQAIELNSYCYVYISPIPTVSVVGEGEVIDLRKLSSAWGRKTLEDQLIPSGFQFPYYRVATPKVKLYRPGKAKIISVDPPNGSEIAGWDSRERFPDLKSEITIAFDKPPEFPKRKGHHTTYTMPLSAEYVDEDNKRGTIFMNSVHNNFIEVYRFTVSWGSEDIGTADQQEFEYKVRR